MLGPVNSLKRLLAPCRSRACADDRPLKQRRKSDAQPVRKPGPPLDQTLPTELILKISGYLRPETRAALALTSRKMYRILGSDSVSSLDDESKVELLYYLEKDGRLFPNILCEWCFEVHSPFPSPDWTIGVANDGSERECEEFTNWDEEKASSLSLPWRLHYNTISAVMEGHRNGWNGLEAEKMGYTETATGPNDRDWLRIRIQYTYKIVKGSLVLKTERLVPIRSTQNPKAVFDCMRSVSEWMVGNMERKGASDQARAKVNWQLNKICVHRGWVDSGYDCFLSDSESEKVLTNLRVSPWKRIQMWTDRAATEKPGRVAPCPHCYTDYALAFVPAIQDREDRGNVCVLTTWKDLGTGLSICDGKWQTHLMDRAGKRDNIRHPDECDIASAYEGVKQERSGVDFREFHYSPTVDQKVLRDLVD